MPRFRLCHALDREKVLLASKAYRQSQDCISEYLNTHVVPNENSCVSER